MFYLKTKYWILVIAGLISCRHEPLVKETMYNGYPEEIGDIMIGKCATAGCHNEKSKVAAAGLSLESWESMMLGGRNNAAAISFSPQKSLVFLFTNTFDDLGPQVTPTMPYATSPLSRKEVLAIKNWLAAGAPDDEGHIAFSGTNERKKVYVLNSLCDEVTVFDLESGLIMRYVKAGINGDEGFPESIEVAPDGRKWYVLFGSGEFVQFDAGSDQRIKQLTLEGGIWRSFFISPDSRTAYLSDWSGNSALYGGRIAMVDLENMTLKSMIGQPTDSIYFPFGVTMSDNGEWLLASCYTGNFIYKINLSSSIPVVHRIVIDETGKTNFSHPDLRPGIIRFLPDESNYLVLCERSNELRIFDHLTDQLIKTVPLGNFPQDLVISQNAGYIFISCMEDQDFSSVGKGSVYILDANSFDVIKKIYTGYQPKSMAMDEANDLVYVVNRNADPVGADAPHHYTDCDGNNGYVTIIDATTLELLKDFKAEVSVDPFGAAIRN